MKFLSLLLLMIVSSAAYAQSPNSFKYQATARTSQGELVVNQEVGMRVSVIHDDPTGEVVYQEIFSTTTNSFGLININIGEGVSEDNFSQIQWSEGAFFIKIEMDVNGGNDYQDFGTSQLLSVPYALYSNTSGSSNYTFNPTSPSGYKNLEPITFQVYDGHNYTVPSGKILYILNIYGYYTETELMINDIPIARGRWNINASSSGAGPAVLAQPILVNEGDVISVNRQSSSFNGYLIDK